MSAIKSQDDRLSIIVKALNRVANILGDDVNAHRIMMTSQFLAQEFEDNDVGDDQIYVACMQVMKRETRFPSPAKFIEYGKGSDRLHAEEALEMVMRAINSWGDMGEAGAKSELGPAIWRVIRSFGGWYSLCTREDFNMGVFRAQFLQSYSTRISHWEASGELDEMKALENPNHPMKQLDFKSNDLDEAIKRKPNLKLIDDGVDTMDDDT